MLYPVENEIRQVKELDGIWRFRREEWLGQGVDEEWYMTPLRDTVEMPVPSSYNDITTDKELRDHVGRVWYERDFFIPVDWREKRMVLRFGSVTHHGVVYVNGVEVARHKGGFLPFEAEIGDAVAVGKNRLTVAVSNMLDHDCLPFGCIKEADPLYFPGRELEQVYQFDFFNYSGIHRPVKLYTTPLVYIKDITVKTDIIAGTDGFVDYSVEISDAVENVQVTLLDEEGNAVAEACGTDGRLTVKDAHFWGVRAPYLYELEVVAGEDRYTLPVGIRTVRVTEKQLLINGSPVYLKGFGKHEDSDIRGKGLDDALNVRDFELMKWIGANSFRTSHYPYSEEIMQMADRQGFLVIDEAPAVGLNFWGGGPMFVEGCADGSTLAHHKDVLTELYTRDKNHPSVIMWSVANEAQTKDEAAPAYFAEVAAHIRALDDTRPITYVTDQFNVENDTVMHLFDVICINCYYSWYYSMGHLPAVYQRLTADFTAYFEKHKKPVLISEYGTDTIAGLHKLPEVIFSEEYQIEFYRENNRALDDLDFVIGEHPWAFADFMTSFGLRRIDGNKKGIFTRQRQPKGAAFVIRERWLNKK